MSASLGSTTYTTVVWTAGDTITEAKQDSMVANDQAYDSHGAEGLLLDNNKSFAGVSTGSANRNLIKLSSGDEVEIGDTDLTGEHIKIVQGMYQSIQTASDGATITFDLSKGNKHKVTLGGNRTLALSNIPIGMSFVIRITQDGTGSRTVTWFSTIKWDYGTTPTLTTTANKTDSFGFICTANGAYDGYILGQGL